MNVEEDLTKAWHKAPRNEFSGYEDSSLEELMRAHLLSTAGPDLEERVRQLPFPVSISRGMVLVEEEWATDTDWSDDQHFRATVLFTASRLLVENEESSLGALALLIEQPWPRPEQGADCFQPEWAELVRAYARAMQAMESDAEVISAIQTCSWGAVIASVLPDVSESVLETCAERDEWPSITARWATSAAVLWHPSSAEQLRARIREQISAPIWYWSALRVLREDMEIHADAWVHDLIVDDLWSDLEPANDESTNVFCKEAIAAYSELPQGFEYEEIGEDIGPEILVLIAQCRVATDEVLKLLLTLDDPDLAQQELENQNASEETARRAESMLAKR